MEAQKKEKVAKLEKKQTEIDVKGVKEGKVSVEVLEAKIVEEKKEKELDLSKFKLKEPNYDELKEILKGKEKIEDK